MAQSKDSILASQLLSDRCRLIIMATLASARDPVDFNYLLNAHALSKGNLSSHMKKLEDNGMITIVKDFVGRKPHTTYAITHEGRTALKQYVAFVEGLLKNNGMKNV